MPCILNIETSTDICSVCIAHNGEVLVLRETERSYSHSEVIAIYIKECFDEAGIAMSELDAVAVCEGPGSYTALRIGTATAKGICFSLDIPLIAISTMKALANALYGTAKENELIVPMIDARRMESYAAIYDNKLQELLPVAPHILTEGLFSPMLKNQFIHFCGDGAAKSEPVFGLSECVYHEIECSSTHMIALSEEKYKKKIFADLSYFEPMYYKSANITVQKKNILQTGI